MRKLRRHIYEAGLVFTTPLIQSVPAVKLLLPPPLLRLPTPSLSSGCILSFLREMSQEEQRLCAYR